MEDSPKLNKGAIVSLLVGLVATLILLYGLVGKGGIAVCLPSFAFGMIALGTGIAAMIEIRRSEGTEQGSAIAVLGILLGLFPTLFWFVFEIGCFLQGSCL